MQFICKSCAEGNHKPCKKRAKRLGTDTWCDCAHKETKNELQ